MLTEKPGEACSVVAADDEHPYREVAVKRRTDPAVESNPTTYGLRIVESFTIHPGVHSYVMPTVSPRTLGSSTIDGPDVHALYDGLRAMDGHLST
jgi:hypothetical protein